jgi:solute carrier family 35 protein F1/2
LFATFLSTIFEKHFQPYWLYFPSFTVVILGLIVYFWHSTRTSLEMYYLLLLTTFAAEQEGVNDIRKPSYVAQRGEAVPEVSESEKQAEV